MNTPLTILSSKVRLYLVSAVCGMAMAGLAPSAFATLIAYEGFDYADGSVSIGQSGLVAAWNGGIGWAGPWEDIAPDGGNSFVNPASSTIEAASDIQSGSLSYTDLSGRVLVTVGNKIHNSGTNISATLGTTATSRPARNLASFIITNGTTTWISFIGQRTGQSNATTGVYDRGANISFFNTNVWGFTGQNAGRFSLGESSGTAVGQTNDTWGFTPLGQGSQRRQSALLFTNVALVLVRIDHHDDNDPNVISNALEYDDLYIWLNPSNLASEPPISAAYTNYLSTETNGLAGLDFAFNRLVLFAGNLSGANPPAEWLLDEIRIGTTYADVVPFTGGPPPLVPPRWTSIAPGGGSVSLTLTGAPNTTVTVEVSSDLSGNNWSSNGTVNLDGGGIGTFSDGVTNSQRYYRAKP